jgi:hypothetical protein
MGLVDDIKGAVKRSGANKGKFLYFKPGTKIRVRFLQELDDGLKVLFHDSYQAGINEPCQELFDRECKHHEDEDLRHGDVYMWSVWDYESKEVKILMGRVNNCSPIPALVGMYDTYKTIMDRDYVITKNGSGTTASFTVVPMDKVKFRNEKVTPFSESKVLKLIDKAFPADSDEDDEDEDEEPKKKKKGKKVSKSDEKKKKKKPVDEDEEEDEEAEEEAEEEEAEEDEEESEDYEDMTAKELYKLCKKHKIDVQPKKSESFYIKKLKAADEEDSDDEDEEDDEAWE